MVSLEGQSVRAASARSSEADHFRRPLGGRLKATAKRLLLAAPALDFLYCLILFVRVHRRLPRRGSGLFNDYLFFVKTGRALLDPLCQFCTDKVLAKHFIDQVVGYKVTPETYAVFVSVDEISRVVLPERCVLKPSHSNGGIVFLEGSGADLTDFDYQKLRKKYAHDMYQIVREKNYKYLRKRIICEHLIESPEQMKDYKFFCYKGKVKLVSVCHQYNSERNLHENRHPYNMYDSEWNPLHVTVLSRPKGPWERRPAMFPEMRDIAERIAEHFDFVRVDMYVHNDRVYVGELTFCHLSAHGKYATLEEEREVSRLLFGAAPAESR